jgi:hypothetical protein
MHPRRELLIKIATVNGSFDGSDTGAFSGETCVETRNTIYRFRDGVCFAVSSRNAGRRPDRASALVGMRIVGWLTPAGPAGSPPPRMTLSWAPGSCAVLWRASLSREEDGAVALTSPTTDFTRGVSPARLQAFHDAQPPCDSSMYRRSSVPSPPPAKAATGSFTRVHEPVAQPRLMLVPPPRPRPRS